ncbi:MAG: hypothetical protein A2020_13445 [Lentisphaerae bacterium GWF2_45_14]|nr:MAG: hypothetical protein A2020_13445 [Lentisphaerae bacterium GWF2_45_14]
MGLPRLFLILFASCAITASAFASDLFKAVSKESSDDVAEILKTTTDINKKDQFGRTALHRAVNRGDLEIVEMIIAKGADVNAKDIKGETPLHAAAWKENEDIIRFLIENKADPNIINAYGQTAQEIVLMLKATPSPVNTSQNNADLKAIASYRDFKAKNNDLEKNDPGIEGFNLTTGKYINKARESYFSFNADMTVVFSDPKNGERKGTYSVEGRYVYVKLRGMSRKLKVINFTELKDSCSGLLFNIDR